MAMNHSQTVQPATRSQYNSPKPSVARQWLHRLLTIGMLACFALGGWLWTNESSSRHSHATAATTAQSRKLQSADHSRTLKAKPSSLSHRLSANNSLPEPSTNEPKENEPSSEYVTKNIEEIVLGQRLVGRNPLRHEASAPSNINPTNWREVRLTMMQGEVRYDLAFLRSVQWLDAVRASVGHSIDLELPEMGLNGPALVEAIESCPTIEPDDGTGRMIVTGTMSHFATNVLELTITGLDESLGVTTTHPIWSEDRQAFVTAGELQTGEHLRQANGEQAQLTSIMPKRGPPELVYNLEVDAEHVYHVTASGVLVHNTCVSWTSSLPGAMSDHMFSAKHGIEAFGASRDALKSEVGELLAKASEQKLLKSGSNQIETLINGQQATVRAFFDSNGELMKANLWSGSTARKLGNLIQW